MRIAVVGGGAGGLYTGLLLSRKGHEVVLVEQHRLDPAPDVESAAESAFRPSAPQIVHFHAVLARGGGLLRAHLPDVYEKMLASGVVEVSLTELEPAGGPPRSDDGDGLYALMTRRSTFDWALQQAVAREPGFTVNDETRVLGLLSGSGDPPRVTGLRTDQGDIHCDLVVDTSGRRAPVERWLSEIGAKSPVVRTGECGLIYFSRQYRIRAGTVPPGDKTTRIIADLDEFTVGFAPGDNDTMQLVIATLSGDNRFRGLKEPAVYEAVLNTIPAYARWLEVLDPITPIYQMSAPPNVLRRIVVDGQPVVTGLLSVGDALCTTNPTFGRGLSLALWAGTDLAEVVDKHPDDPVEQARALDRAIDVHIAPYFEDQVATDETRLALLRHNIYGDPIPPPPPLDPDRINFSQLLLTAPFSDTAAQAFSRVMLMVSSPVEIYNDPAIVASVKQTVEANNLYDVRPILHRAPEVVAPTREQIEAALATQSV